MHYWLAALIIAANCFLGPANAQPRSTSASLLELDASAVPDLNSDGVRQVQRLLRARAYDPGQLDGVVGARTRDTIRRFQQNYGMKDTGIIDNQLLFALGAAELSVSR